MKATITYKESHQISPDSWDSWTEVVHVKETDTIADIHKMLSGRGWKNGVNVELHIQPEDGQPCTTK